MAQIALNLENVAEQGARHLRAAQPAAEFSRQRLLGEIGDVRDHARHREAAGRHPPVLPVAAALPVGVGEDRLPPDFIERDVLRRVVRGGGDRHRREHAVGVVRGPFQHLHAAERAARNREQAADAEMVDQALLRAHHVADGHRRKIDAPSGRRRLLRIVARRAAARSIPCSRRARWSR